MPDTHQAMTAMFRLVRHAAHDNLGRVLTGRSSGFELSQEGREQARSLALELSGQFDLVCSSPQTRARETAEILAGSAGVPLEISEALDEIDFGEWSGKTFTELETAAAWQRWNEARHLARTPAGETIADVAKRVLGLMEELRQQHPGAVIALVSHADVIKAAVCRCLGLGFDRMHSFEVSPASVTTIALGDWGGALLALNEHACGFWREGDG